MCAARTCEGETASGFHALGKGDQQTIAEPTRGSGGAGGGDFGPALRRNGSDAELGKMDEYGRND
jgi:hypothetical protein